MKKILLTSIVALFSIIASGQIHSFDVQVDTNRILIGEQIKLEIKATLDKDSQFEWPLLEDTLSGLEILDIGKIDTLQKSNKWIIQQSYILTSFDSGYAAIPPLVLISKSEKQRSTAIALEVGMPKVDEEGEITDIKKPIDAPINWLRIITWVVAILVILAIVVLIIYKLKNKKPSEIEVVDNSISPYDYAQKKLQEIEKAQLWQAGKIKEYYTELTDVLRVYLERQMNLNAMESTADEVEELILSLGLNQELNDKVSQLLQTSSMVKFAKEKPGLALNERSIATVKEFLQATKPSDIESNETLNEQGKI